MTRPFILKLSKWLLISPFSLSVSLLSFNAYALVSFDRSLGGNLQIINGSHYTLNKINQSKNKMKQWDFPAAIAPSATPTIHMEFGNENGSWWNMSEWWMHVDKSDMSGYVAYQVDCGNNQLAEVKIEAKVISLGTNEPIQTNEMFNPLWLMMRVNQNDVYNPYLTATVSGASCVTVQINGNKGNGDLGFIHDGTVVLYILNN